MGVGVGVGVHIQHMHAQRGRGHTTHVICIRSLSLPPSLTLSRPHTLCMCVCQVCSLILRLAVTVHNIGDLTHTMSHHHTYYVTSSYMLYLASGSDGAQHWRSNAAARVLERHGLYARSGTRTTSKPNQNPTQTKPKPQQCPCHTNWEY